MITRREVLAGLTAFAAGAATAAQLPENRNVKWALGSNLWNSFPGSHFTDILDVMRDTGFIGLRLTQYPQILERYDTTATADGSRGFKARPARDHNLIQRGGG